MRKKFFAIIGALIAGGIGIAAVSLAPQAAHGFASKRKRNEDAKSIFGDRVMGS